MKENMLEYARKYVGIQENMQINLLEYAEICSICKICQLHITAYHAYSAYWQYAEYALYRQCHSELLFCILFGI